jgi:hypothetical protein
VSWVVAELVGKCSLLVRVPAALSTPSLRLRVRDIIPWRELGKASLAALAAAAGVFVLRAGTGQAWGGLPEGFIWRTVPLAVAGVLFVLGYVGVLYATGVKPLGLLARARRNA